MLSDGVSSRLFTEVREKRGLCYTVSASCHSIKDRAAVICYSGTTTERAQETLDVILDQIVKLHDGVNQEELDRLKVQIRSGLIMLKIDPAHAGTVILTTVTDVVGFLVFLGLGTAFLL